MQNIPPPLCSSVNSVKYTRLFFLMHTSGLEMWLFAVECLMLLAVLANAQQSPGDESDRCVNTDLRTEYPDNVKTLMDSYSYEVLLPGSGSGAPPREGAVWSDRSFDGNDVDTTFNPTYVSEVNDSVQFH